MNISCTRKRMPQNRMTISYPRVGRNRIRPTNDPKRGEYVQNRTNVSRNRARITQNRTNPAYIRKWMTQIHGIRFLSKTSVGRMQYAPTRGRKWYARDGGIRDRRRKWYVRNCGIHDWTQERYVQGGNVLVWDREGRVRSCEGIAWAKNIKWRECYLVALLKQLNRKNVS